MLKNIYEYFFPNNTKIIELYPNEKFINGKTYLSILQIIDNNIITLPKNYVIKKAKLVSIDTKPYIRSYVNIDILFENYVLFSNILLFNADDVYENDLDIHITSNTHMIVTLTNTKQKLPLEHNLLKFKIILELEPTDIHIDEYETIESQIYNSIDEAEKDIIDERKGVGICFSGGGGRSFSATLGYIRALRNMNLLKDIKYVSCVSGSTWAWVPFTFMNEIMNEDIFIGSDVFNFTSLNNK